MAWFTTSPFYEIQKLASQLTSDRETVPASNDTVMEQNPSSESESSEQEGSGEATAEPTEENVDTGESASAGEQTPEPEEPDMSPHARRKREGPCVKISAPMAGVKACER